MVLIVKERKGKWKWKEKPEENGENEFRNRIWKQRSRNKENVLIFGRIRVCVTGAIAWRKNRIGTPCTMHKMVNFADVAIIVPFGCEHPTIFAWKRHFKTKLFIFGKFFSKRVVVLLVSNESGLPTVKIANQRKMIWFCLGFHFSQQPPLSMFFNMHNKMPLRSM